MISQIQCMLFSGKWLFYEFYTLLESGPWSIFSFNFNS